MATKKYEVVVENESREEHHEFDSLPEADALYESLRGKEGVFEVSLHDLEVSETLKVWCRAMRQ